MAGGLTAMSITDGERVALRLINRNDWAYAFSGVLMAGAIAVLVNTRFSESEVEYVVSDAGAKYVVEDAGDLPTPRCSRTSRWSTTGNATRPASATGHPPRSTPPPRQHQQPHRTVSNEPVRLNLTTSSTSPLDSGPSNLRSSEWGPSERSRTKPLEGGP